jgi:hypothetical protein
MQVARICNRWSSRAAIRETNPDDRAQILDKSRSMLAFRVRYCGEMTGHRGWLLDQLGL